MTLREIELELWREIGGQMGFTQDKIDQAVKDAKLSNDIMDHEIPNGQEEAVRTAMRKIILEVESLKAQRN